MSKQTAFQDLFTHNGCFGCGPENAGGLRIKSHWDGDDTVCTFHPEPHHNAGPPNVVNGGIIATIIDCHCVCSAIADRYRREGREIGTDPRLWYVLGSISVRYKAPAIMGRPLTFRAKVKEVEGKKTLLTCTVSSGDEACATGDVVAIRVPADWRHRPMRRPCAAGSRR